MKQTGESKRRLVRLRKICEALLEVEVSGEQHLGFKVRKKTFGYYLFDHHGDGRVALCVKAPAGKDRLYLENAPERFFTPSYLGSKGWVALRLDGKTVDWDEVQDLVKEFYQTGGTEGIGY